MTFFIRCSKGHSRFTTSILEVGDDEGNPTGARLVYLSCAECGEEEVLEVKEDGWRAAATRRIRHEL